MARRSAAVPSGAKMPRVLLSVLVGESTFRRLCEIEATCRPVVPEALTGWLDDAVFERILFDAPDRVLSVSRQRAFPAALREANGQRLCDSHNAAKGTTHPASDPDHHLRWLEDPNLLKRPHNPGRDPP